MMNRWRFIELTFAAILLAAGAALLYFGSVDRSVTAGAVLIAGAALFSVGALMLVSAARSIVWHRRMIRHAMPHRGMNSSSHRHRGMSLRHR